MSNQSHVDAKFHHVSVSLYNLPGSSGRNPRSEPIAVFEIFRSGATFGFPLGRYEYLSEIFGDGNYALQILVANFSKLCALCSESQSYYLEIGARVAARLWANHNIIVIDDNPKEYVVRSIGHHNFLIRVLSDPDLENTMRLNGVF